MKKRLSLLLALVLAFSLTACAEAPQDANLKEPSNVTNESEPAKEPSTEQEPSGQASIAETVLVDESDIKITATGLDADGFLGVEVKLLIENNSDQDLTFQARNVSVNGYMVEPIMSADVAAGKKANDSMTLDSSELEACGIKTIADIEFAFAVMTTEDYEAYLDTKQIQLKTSAAEGFKYSYDEAGTPVYEGNGIKIVARGLSEDDSIFGPGLILYIYNSGDKAVTIQTQDVSVNGFMLDPIFSQDVFPGKHSVSAVTFMDTDLEENNITNISEIELSFHIFDTDSWDSITDTDKVTLSF